MWRWLWETAQLPVSPTDYSEHMRLQHTARKFFSHGAVKLRDGNKEINVVILYLNTLREMR